MRAALFFGLLLSVPAHGQEDLFSPAEQAVQRARAEGLWLSASADGAFLERDLYFGASLGIGYEHDAFALHLRAPVYLRALDLEPRALSPRAPACAVLRCEALGFSDGALDLGALSRILEEVRVGEPGDAFHLRGGPLLVTLGTGQLVDRYLNSPSWEERQTGAFFEASLPFVGLSFKGTVGNVLAPQEFFGARLEARPLSLLGFLKEKDTLASLLSRVTFGLDIAGDLAAPLPEPRLLSQVSLPDPPTQPLVGASLDLAWPLFEPGGAFEVAPFVAASGLLGLEPAKAGTLSPFGLGASAGGRLVLRVPFVGLRFDGRLGLESPAHRTGLFGPLYAIERERALVGAARGGGILDVPAPGGFIAQAGLELVVADVLRLGARLSETPAAGGDTAEAYAEVALFTFRAGAHALRRGVTGATDLFVWDARTVVVAEGAVGLWGPLSLFLRYTRTPRADGDKLRLDDDGVVGLSADVVLGVGRD